MRPRAHDGLARAPRRRARGLKAKSRRSLLGAFRALVGWLRKRGELREIPEFPRARVDEYDPQVLSVEAQDAADPGHPVAKTLAAKQAELQRKVASPTRFEPLPGDAKPWDSEENS